MNDVTATYSGKKLELNGATSTNLLDGDHFVIKDYTNLIYPDDHLDSKNVIVSIFDRNDKDVTANYDFKNFDYNSSGIVVKHRNITIKPDDIYNVNVK